MRGHNIPSTIGGPQGAGLGLLYEAVEWDGGEEVPLGDAAALVLECWGKHAFVKRGRLHGRKVRGTSEDGKEYRHPSVHARIPNLVLA